MMNCAPLNLAHFHERRADKLMKRHRYDDAFKAIETSLLYVEDAYNHVKIPKGVDVLNTQKWDYERKLNQIQMRQLQHDKMKSKEIVPIVEGAPNNVKKEVNAQTIARSIDKTIKDFNDKYGSSLLENIHRAEPQPKENINSIEQKGKKINGSSKEMLIDIERNIRRLGLMEGNLQTADDDLPSLAPLELPAFDYTVFGS